MTQPEEAAADQPTDEPKKKRLKLRLSTLLIVLCVLSVLAGLSITFPAPFLTVVLKHGNESRQEWAITKLESLGPSGVPGLIEGLGADPMTTPYLSPAGSIFTAFMNIGEPAVPYLMEALGHENPNVRFKAVWALRRIGREAGAAIPALTEVSKGKDPRVAKAAGLALHVIRQEIKKSKDFKGD